MAIVTEKELQEICTSPRVTLDAVESNIVETTYYHHDTLTICVLNLKNGSTVTGESGIPLGGESNAQIR